MVLGSDGAAVDPETSGFGLADAGAEQPRLPEPSLPGKEQGPPSALARLVDQVVHQLEEVVPTEDHWAEHRTGTLHWGSVRGDGRGPSSVL